MIKEFRATQYVRTSSKPFIEIMREFAEKDERFKYIKYDAHIIINIMI